MRYSCHLVAWPRLRDGIVETSRLGFAGCEAFADAVLPYEGREGELMALLAPLGLRFSALYADVSLTDAASARRAATMLGRLGADRLVVSVHPSGAPLGALAALLDDVGTLARSAGGALCVHPHRGSAVERADDLDALLAATDPTLVLTAVDTGHLVLGGDDAAVVIRGHRERLGAVHLKDVDATGHVVALGRGLVDLAAVFAALDEARYDGWLTVELEDSADPARDLLASQQHLARLGRWVGAAA